MDWKGMRALTINDVWGSLKSLDELRRRQKRKPKEFSSGERALKHLHFTHHKQRVRQLRRIRRAARHVNRGKNG